MNGTLEFLLGVVLILEAITLMALGIYFLLVHFGVTK